MAMTNSVKGTKNAVLPLPEQSITRKHCNLSSILTCSPTCETVARRCVGRWLTVHVVAIIATDPRTHNRSRRFQLCGSVLEYLMIFLHLFALIALTKNIGCQGCLKNHSGGSDASTDETQRQKQQVQTQDSRSVPRKGWRKRTS